MRRSYWLLTGLFALSMAVGTAPVSRPAPPDDTLVSRLIRQLDSPQFAKRQEAAKALVALGPQILPRISKAADSASFEAKASLAQIAHILKDLLKGAVIYRVAPGSPAETAGLRAGDIIVRVDEEAITDCDHYLQVVSEGLRDPHNYVIRSDGQLREVPLVPRRLGVALADYDEKYGLPLVEAIRAFTAGHWAGAEAGFEEAQQAGLVLGERDELLPMFAVAAYGAGHPSLARKLLDDLAEAVPGLDVFGWYQEVLPELGPTLTHLQIHVAQRRFWADPSAFSAGFDYAQRLCAVHQYADGLVALLHAERNASVEFEESASWTAMLGVCEFLEMEPAALGAIERLMGTESRPAVWSKAAATAAHFGHHVQAADLMDRLVARSRMSGRLEAEAAAQAIQFRLRAGGEDQVRRFIDDCTAEDCARIMGYLAPEQFRWFEARAVLAHLARRALEDRQATPETCAHACTALARMDGPDRRELGPALGRLLTHPEFAAAGDGQGMSELQRVAALLIADGRLDEARHRLGAAPAAASSATLAALAFLESPASGAIREEASWGSLRAAWKLGDDRWLLLTQHDRLGIVGGSRGSVREVAAPAPRWFSAGATLPLFVSPASGTVFGVADETLYTLNEEQAVWRPVVRCPYGYLAGLEQFGSLLDTVIAALATPAGQPPQIVWPPSLAMDVRGVVSFMLSNGDWVTCDLVRRAVLEPRKAVEGFLKTPVEIYDVLPPDQPTGVFHLFTSQGFLYWDPATGAMGRLELPGVARPMAVVPSEDGPALPAGRLRLALMPDDGGTTFILNTSTHEIVSEGCVNELIPPTFWLQKSETAKRELITRAVQQAGFQALPATTRPAGS